MTPEFRRRGRKIHGVGWFHDGSAAGTVTLGFGNNWVIAAIIVTLPFGSSPGGATGAGHPRGQGR